MDAGDHAARRVADETHFPLELIVAVTHEGPKHTGSTDGMMHTQRTSPYYPTWVEHAPKLATEIEAAIVSRDIERLGPLVEQSALLMHSSMWGAVPPLIYFSPSTLRVMDVVTELRRRGTPAFFTMDAGPHVKVITLPEYVPSVLNALDIEAVVRTIHCKLGGDARVISEQPG